MSDLISREEALMALTGFNLPTDRDKLIALYDKRIKALQTVEAVPLSVIEDIKAELPDHSFWQDAGGEPLVAIRDVLEIIDKAVREVEK